MSTDDQLLLERWAQQSDPEAFRELVARYGALVYAACRRVLGTPTGADDAAQECFAALAHAGDRPGPYLGAWLHRVATYHALNQRRKETRLKQREETFARAQAVAREITWDDIDEYIDEAINALPDSLRAPLVAYYLEQQPQGAIAEALGVSREHVNRRIAKGIAQIRATLNKKGIYTATAALAALLSAHAAVAVPPALAARLAKVALSGPNTTAPLAVRPALQQALAVPRILNLNAVYAIAITGVVILLAAGFALREALQANAAHRVSHAEQNVANTPSPTQPSPTEPATAPTPATALGSTATAPEPLTTPGKASISGVLHSRLGAGLVDYSVEAYPLGVPAATARPSYEWTAERGAFFFNDLEPGRYFLHVDRRREREDGKKNRLHTPVGPASQNTVVTLAPDEAKTGIVLILDDTLGIAGRVTDDTGKPLPGIQVNIDIDRDYASAHPHPLNAEVPQAYPGEFSFSRDTDHGIVRTDEHGEFSFLALDDADYRVLASEMGYKRSAEQTVHAGTTNVEIVLEKNTDFTVSGRVIDMDTKAPITRFKVGYSWAFNALWGTLKYLSDEREFTDNQGRFTLTVNHEGSGGFLIARADGYFQNNISISGMMAPGEDHIEGIVIEVPRARTVRGHVYGPADRPVADAMIFLGAPPSPSAVMVDEDALARTDDDGAFAVFVPAARAINLSAISQQNTAWKEFLVGAMAQLPAASDDIDGVVLKLTRDGATVHGKLTTNGQPLKARVDFSADQNIYKTWIGNSDETGEYRLDHLPPLSAATMSIDSQWAAGLGATSPNVGVNYTSIRISKPVEIAAEADNEANLEYVSGDAQVHGLVRVEGNVPTKTYGRIVLKLLSGVSQEYYFEADDRGEFIAGGLPAVDGVLNITAISNDAQPFRGGVALHLQPGQRIELSVALPSDTAAPSTYQGWRPF